MADWVGSIMLIFLTLFGLVNFFILQATAAKTHSNEVYSPPIMFSLFVFVYVVARTFYFAIITDLSFSEIPITTETMIYGHVAISLGILSFCFGYFAIQNRFLKSYRVITINGIITQYALISLGLILLFFYFRKMGVFNNPLNPFVGRYFATEYNERTSLTFLTMGADFIYVVFLFRLAKKPENVRLSAIEYLLILIPIFTNLVTTNRGSIILYILGAMCVSNSLKNRTFPWMKFGIFTMLLIGSLGLARGLVQSGDEARYGNAITASSVFIKTLEHVLQRPYHLAIDKTGYIVQSTSESNLYLYGSSLATFLAAPIPRVVWRDKPSVRIGPWVAENIYNRDNRSGVPPGFIAELFLNFSWFGISIGMFLYGCLCRIIFNSHIRFNHLGSGWRVFYAIFLMSIVFRLLGADFSGAIILFLRLLFPFLVIIFLSRLSSESN
ncbi:O-antigen polysaccharide polymerase Wzy [Tritonibacter mobilis]|uniref:O-antigen polysaccharide polymerase Wzy n=1 Tax=Tritonibacter mobilis TaxID=379347 RepID=UPI0014037DC8|nr:O-antigen polysaccharide polymerase Wzy [Tritonibacter mobilis]NHM17556.1 O-antigen polysaccharide polymerase Wzy [Tritonibacter mobilis]NHM21744.1 O-antigen polysaccharide polymerase Wzy [Tritonibacter mobilis]